MILQDVPTQISLGTSLEEAITNISAIVTFEEGVTKTVTASELSFSAIPDINQTGDKTLVAVYNKTFRAKTVINRLWLTHLLRLWEYNQFQ